MLPVDEIEAEELGPADQGLVVRGRGRQVNFAGLLVVFRDHTVTKGEDSEEVLERSGLPKNFGSDRVSKEVDLPVKRNC